MPSRSLCARAAATLQQILHPALGAHREIFFVTSGTIVARAYDPLLAPAQGARSLGARGLDGGGGLGGGGVGGGAAEAAPATASSAAASSTVASSRANSRTRVQRNLSPGRTLEDRLMGDPVSTERLETPAKVRVLAATALTF